MGSQGVGHDWATELHWTSVSWSFTYASAPLGMVLVLVVRTPIALPVPAPACGVGSPRSPPPPVFLEACGTSDGTLPSFPVSLPAPCWCPLPWGHWGAVSPLSHCQSCSARAALSVPEDAEKSPCFASFSPLSQSDMACIAEPCPLCLQASAHRLRSESVEFRQGAKVREKTLFLSHAPFCIPGLFLPVVPPSQTSSSRPFPSV